MRVLSPIDNNSAAAFMFASACWKTAVFENACNVLDVSGGRWAHGPFT